MPELARRVLAKLGREQQELEAMKGQAPPAERARISASVLNDPDQAVQDPIFNYLGMSLDAFEQRGAMLEVAVPWLDKTLWFVPSPADAESVLKQGVSRGRIWTARELMGLLTIPGLTKERVAKVAQAKAIFEGTVTP